MATSKVNNSQKAQVAEQPPLLFKVLDSHGAEFKRVTKRDPNTLTAKCYLVLKHSEHYQIELDNPFLCMCEADVDIDGFPVGSWQLHSHQIALLERPACVSKKFTLLRTKLVKNAESAKDKLVTITAGGGRDERRARSHGICAPWKRNRKWEVTERNRKCKVQPTPGRVNY